MAKSEKEFELKELKDFTVEDWKQHYLAALILMSGEDEVVDEAHYTVCEFLAEVEVISIESYTDEGGSTLH